MSEHLGEDAELYALGVLDDDERARVEGHAAGCPACARRLGEAESVVAGLAVSCPASSEKRQPARAFDRRWAAAAAFAIALGTTAGAVLQTRHLQATLGADDAVLATLATSHFNHVQFARVVRDAPEGKLLNARHGEWFYVILAAPVAGVHVVALRGTAATDLGVAQVHGGTTVFFERDPGIVDRVELERDGTLIETAIPSYRDE